MSDPSSESQKPQSRRKYFCVLFDCCRIYSRIYQNKAQTAYVGWCPRCAKKVTFPIHPSGTDCRFFRVI